jgi:hypothetical protein
MDNVVIDLTGSESEHQNTSREVPKKRKLQQEKEKEQTCLEENKKDTKKRKLQQEEKEQTCLEEKKKDTKQQEEPIDLDSERSFCLQCVQLVSTTGKQSPQTILYRCQNPLCHVNTLKLCEKCNLESFPQCPNRWTRCTFKKRCQPCLDLQTPTDEQQKSVTKQGCPICRHKCSQPSRQLDSIGRMNISIWNEHFDLDLKLSRQLDSIGRVIEQVNKQKKELDELKRQFCLTLNDSSLSDEVKIQWMSDLSFQEKEEKT